MEDWITQSEAANLRGISVQVINNWVRRGRVRTKERYGKTLVSRSEVLAFNPEENKGGRPPKPKASSIDGQVKMKSSRKSRK
jgi:hypothetical protein